MRTAASPLDEYYRQGRHGLQGVGGHGAGQTHLNFESFKEEVVIQGYFEAFTLQARLPGETSQ